MMTHAIQIIISSFLLMAGTLLPIINPPGAAPIFLSFTKGATDEMRTLMAKKVAINTIVMLTVATWLGNVILSFFGISIPIVRVAGGVLVISSAWSLLNAKDVDADTTQAYANTLTLEQVKRSAFFPFTFPILCGPGSISAAITVGATIYKHDTTDTITFLSGLIGNLLGVIAVAVIIYYLLRFANRFMKLLGDTGTAIFMKLSAFLLLCIGVQIVWSGILDLAVTLRHTLS